MVRKVTPTKAQAGFLKQGLNRSERVLINEVKEELLSQDFIRTTNGSGFQKTLKTMIGSLCQKNLDWAALTPHKQHMSVQKYKSLYDYVY